MQTESTAAPAGLAAAIFDLDGTLVATEHHWLPAAQRAALAVAEQIGWAGELPSARDWLRIVGLPSALGLELILPDWAERDRALLQERAAEEEDRLLRAGAAALMPGALEVLDGLASRGVRLAIATNGSGAYLDRVLESFGLAGRFEAVRSLESPCVRADPGRRGGGPKAAMVADLLSTLGTRSALFVGDRAGDREAAHQNGICHVHFRGGFADPGEGAGADAEIAQLEQLLPLLDGRAAELAAGLGGLAGDGSGALCVLGPPPSDPERWAGELARILASAGARGRVAIPPPVDLGPDPSARAAVLRADRARGPGWRWYFAQDLEAEPAEELAARCFRLHTGDLGARVPAQGTAHHLDVTRPLGPRWLSTPALRRRHP